jgi:predicted amidohydrolase YtcJ
VATVFFGPREAKEFDELGQLIRDFSRKDRSSKILAGFGLSQHSLKERRLITREELDRYENNRPVYLICYDGHSVVIDSRMLELIPEAIQQSCGFDGAAGSAQDRRLFRHRAGWVFRPLRRRSQQTLQP